MQPCSLPNFHWGIQTMPKADVPNICAVVIHNVLCKAVRTMIGAHIANEVPFQKTISARALSKWYGIARLAPAPIISEASIDMKLTQTEGWKWRKMKTKTKRNTKMSVKKRTRKVKKEWHSMWLQKTISRLLHPYLLIFIFFNNSGNAPSQAISKHQWKHKRCTTRHSNRRTSVPGVYKTNTRIYDVKIDQLYQNMIRIEEEKW